MLKICIAVLTLMCSGITAFSAEPDLVEGAKRATAYWNAVFTRCGNNHATAWYAQVPNGPDSGSIQMLSELRIRFKTEDLSQEQRLNGFEFRATTSLEIAPYRWWNAKNKAWGDWYVDETGSPAIVIKKNGVWSTGVAPNYAESRKALTTCSQIPPVEEQKR